MEQASKEAVTLPEFGESSERNPDASFKPDADRVAIEDGNAGDMSQPAAEYGAQSQNGSLAISYASRNEDFVVVDLDSTLQQFHQQSECFPERCLTERQLRTTDAATQSDGDTEKFWKALEERDRRIEELERRIGVQENEIAKMEQEMAVRKIEYAEISSMRRYLDTIPSEVDLNKSQIKEATDAKPIRSLHINQSEERNQSHRLEKAIAERKMTAHSCAEKVSALLPGIGIAGCEEGLGVHIRQEVAACRHECVNQIHSLGQRLEASFFELRQQCLIYVTALERHMKETMSAEHETMRSCATEMTLLRDYVTSMTDVIETIVNLYGPASDSSCSAKDLSIVSKSDTAK